MEWVRFGISALFVTGGLAIYFLGILGLYRFRFVMNRMHAGAIMDTLGLFCVSIGLAVAKGFSVFSWKLLLVFAMLWLTGPISSHLIAKLEYFTDENLNDEVVFSHTETGTEGSRKILDGEKRAEDDDL